MKDEIRDAFGEIHADDALLEHTLAYLRAEAGKRRRKPGGFASAIKIAAAGVVFMLAGFISYSLYFTAAAYVSIDVNPSVELTLNRFDRVIGIHAFGGDGAVILDESGLRGSACGDAAVSVLAAIGDFGYLTGDALISVTVQAADREKEKALCEALLRDIYDKIQPQAESAEIEVFPVSQETWGHAHSCNISPSKLLAILELMEVDETATIEGYADASIRQIRQRTQECGNHLTESGGSGQNAGGQNGQGHGYGYGHGHGGGHH